MPTTSQETPQDMHKTFSGLLERGYDVMGIFICEKLSGTLASAIQAREELASAKDKISIFDSETFAIALRKNFKISNNPPFNLVIYSESQEPL